MQTLSGAVVGAGPAGATAARLLASRGARVSLLEARRLPRPKLCGGGLTPKAQRLVPPSVLETVERRVHRIELRGGRLPALHLDEPEAEIAMVERARFDLVLTEAAAAGAEVRDGERVETVAEDPFGVTLTTRRGRLRVDAVVAADDDPSGIARRLGLGGSAARHALALEVDLPLSSELPADTAVLTFGVRGGYAWYFPKGDHANVGAGSYRETAPTALKEVLARFARSVAAGPQAWVLSSSYSRAIQDPVLEAWRGRAANAPAAQDAIARRARLNGLARMGQYQPEATSWDGRPRRAAPSAQHSQGEAR